MKKIKLILSTVILSLLSSLINAPMVSASTESYGAFYVSPNLPENQVDKTVGYFDLMMEEGMEQTISFDIENQGNEVMIATIDFNDGTTEVNAEKSYRQDIKADSSLIQPVSSMTSFKTKKVEVAPLSKQTITVDLKAPNEKFDGVRVSGFTITADIESNKNQDSNDSGFELGNRLSYLLALQIRMSHQPISKNLNYIESSSSVVNLKSHFISKVQNDQAVVMNEVSLEGSVKSKNGEEVASIHKNTGGILPNTEFIVAYEMNKKKIEAGEYSLHLKITSEDEVWQWSDKVIVDEEEASDLNSSIPKESKDTTLWIVISIGIVLIIILLLLIIILLKRNKKSKE